MPRELTTMFPVPRPSFSYTGERRDWLTAFRELEWSASPLKALVSINISTAVEERIIILPKDR